MEEEMLWRKKKKKSSFSLITRNGTVPLTHTWPWADSWWFEWGKETPLVSPG